MSGVGSWKNKYLRRGFIIGFFPFAFLILLVANVAVAFGDDLKETYENAKDIW